MKPILLMGHTRALTKVKFNHDGDLLFSVSKDNQASVWFSSNGERLGTFDGHTGTIWTIDISSFEGLIQWIVVDY
jgi:translation initiation factor 3 subunit I